MSPENGSLLTELAKYIMEPESINAELVYGCKDCFHKKLKELSDSACDVRSNSKDHDAHVRFQEALNRVFYNISCDDWAEDEYGPEHYEDLPVPPGADPPTHPNL